MKAILQLIFATLLAMPLGSNAQSMKMKVPINLTTEAGDPVFEGYAVGMLVPFKGRNGDLPTNHSVDKATTGREYYMVKDGEWTYLEESFATADIYDETSLYTTRATFSFKNGKLHGPFKVLDRLGNTIFQGTCSNGNYQQVFYTGYHDDLLTKKIQGEVICLSGELTAAQGGQEIFHINDIIRQNNYAMGSLGEMGGSDVIVTGQWKTWWEDGKEATQIDFTAGVIKPVSSRFIEYYPYYKKDQRSIDYYGSGERYLSIPFKRSKEGGQLIFVELQNLRHPNSFTRTGPWEYYRMDGQKKELLERTNYSWRTNKPEGTSIAFYSNGAKKNEVQYADGQLNGKAQYFHENGEVSAFGNYRAGKKKDTWKYFNAEKQLTQEERFDENGVLQGEYKLYFNSGKLKEKGNYVNGKLDGLVNFYHPNGKLSGGNHYSNGLFTRPADYFDANGKAVLTNGNGTQVYYHANGKLSYKANFKNFCRDGLTQWYYDNGQLQQSAIYRYSESSKPDGLRWEIISSFSRSGEKRDAGTLRNGNGTWISYDDKNNTSITTYENGVKMQ